MAGATANAEVSCKAHIVVVEVKYLSAKNVVIHTENCKLNKLWIV